ncbi:MAG: DNA topoisomerase I [Candidatus Diapherotrites archaeon]
MSTIIIAEKQIAGKRVAEILSNGKMKTRGARDAPYFEFEQDGKSVVVVPLKGHIEDVDFGKEFKSWIGPDLRDLVKAEVEYQSTEPSITDLLKKLGEDADKIIVATDDDKEGESIGVEALRYLRQGNPKAKEERARFSAIAPKDLEKAFSNLEKVNYALADSADARREVDLIWGAVLTRFLSLMAGRRGKSFLSVGRVQTPTLALIVEREKERKAFKAVPYWELRAVCEKDAQEFEAFHKEGKFWKKDDAERSFGKKADKGTVTKLTASQRTLAKPVPFNTTEFLRSATALGFRAGEAMNIAESLYMRGLISYPRTDNQTYPASLELKEVLNELLKGKEFAGDIEYIFSLGPLNPSKGKESKDHPPVYPVEYASKEQVGERNYKIYELVVRRFLATLAEEAITDNLSVDIDIAGEPFVAKGQLIRKAGWKKVYPYSALSEVKLPPLKEGDIVNVKLHEMLSKETLPPAHYSQSALIKLMEDLGLGTKATRHEMIQKLYARNYIFGNKAIEANQIGFAVIDALKKHSEEVTKPKMTSDLELEMEEIADGKRSKKEVVDDSRKLLAGILEDLLAHKNEVAGELRNAFREDSILFTCQKCGTGKLRILFGRSGKRFLGCTNYPTCHNSYPLVQKGKIVPTEKFCEFCKAPIVKVFGRRGGYEMCLTMGCESKKDWKKPAPKKVEETAPAAENEKPKTKKVSVKIALPKKEKRPKTKLAPKPKKAKATNKKPREAI